MPDRTGAHLGSKRVISSLQPRALPEVPVSRRYPPEDVEQERDGVVGDVLGEGGAGVGDGDAAPAALAEVDVVDAGAGADDDPEGGEEAEGVGG